MKLFVAFKLIMTLNRNEEMKATIKVIFYKSSKKHIVASDQRLANKNVIKQILFNNC